MRILKMSAAAMLAIFALSACNNEPSTAEDDTVIIKEEPVERGSVGSEKEDDGSSVGFDVESDEDGNVSGKMSGKIDLDDEK